MAKKKAGRRTTRLSIKVDVLTNTIAAHGLSHDEIVDKASESDINVGIRTVRGVINEALASPNSIKALAVVLSLPTAEFVLNADNHRDILDAIDALLPKRVRERIHSKGRIVHPKDPMHCVQDKKNLIRDPGLSRALINGIGVPSLFDAVYNSATFTPIDDAHKDVPFVPGMDYNHFLMIGAVLIVNGHKEKTAIGYHRSVSHLKGTYKHTQGLSILWATGFEFNLKETMDRDMWNWMTLASETPDQAEQAFIGKNDPALLRLLSHKLTLNPKNCSIRPLCVVTNDQRPLNKPRIYTQYVFRIDVTPQRRNQGKARSIDQLMGEFVQEPDQPAAVAFKPDVHTQFVNHKGHTNRMDVAAWHQLHPNKRRSTPQGITAARFDLA